MESGTDLGKITKVVGNAFKYVISDYKNPIIFTHDLMHSTFCELNITSAGFAKIVYVNGKLHVNVWGESKSLSEVYDRPVYSNGDFDSRMLEGVLLS